MKFKFSAVIYKVGINPCVKVPFRITDKMKALKGYIPVKGHIEGHYFEQTLCTVKNEEFRLYVNGPMLKGAKVKVGDEVHFIIEQNETPETRYDIRMPELFQKALKENKLVEAFDQLKPYRKKEILKYLNFLKSEETIKLNVKKVIKQLKAGRADTHIP